MLQQIEYFADCPQSAPRAGGGCLQLYPPNPPGGCPCQGPVIRSRGGKGSSLRAKETAGWKKVVGPQPPPLLSLLARKEIDGERWGPGVEERPLAGSQAASGLDLPCPPPSRRWESQGLKKAPGPHTSRWPSGVGNHLLDTRPMGEKTELIALSILFL